MRIATAHYFEKISDAFCSDCILHNGAGFCNLQKLTLCVDFFLNQARLSSDDSEKINNSS